ncbi:hypothetical protein C8J57DRAFT_1238607 [Mycena rebaudengoi]|nr:hypothetical protein C8J57DRAFT_1238607 [Mycena rebaudengoi]
MASQDPEDYNKYWDINEDYLRASSETLADPDYQPEQSQLHQEQAMLEWCVDRKRKCEAMEAVPCTPCASSFAARTVLEEGWAGLLTANLDHLTGGPPDEGILSHEECHAATPVAEIKCEVTPPPQVQLSELDIWKGRAWQSAMAIARLLGDLAVARMGPAQIMKKRTNGKPKQNQRHGHFKTYRQGLGMYKSN